MATVRIYLMEGDIAISSWAETSTGLLRGACYCLRHSGMVRRTRAGMWRCGVRCYASARNDGPQVAALALPYDWTTAERHLASPIGDDSPRRITDLFEDATLFPPLYNRW